MSLGPSEFGECTARVKLELTDFRPQNPRVPIVPRETKTTGAKGDVPKIYGLI